MRITSLKIDNYRTLESIDLSFPSAYSAICGANDSGKTNVVRAIRALVKGEGPGPTVIFPDEEDLSFKDDYPKWKDTDPSKRKMTFDLSLTLDKTRDVGFYQFVAKQLSIDDTGESLQLSIGVTHQADTPEPIVVVTMPIRVLPKRHAGKPGAVRHGTIGELRGGASGTTLPRDSLRRGGCTGGTGCRGDAR